MGGPGHCLLSSEGFELRALRLDALSEARGVLVQAVQVKDLDGLRVRAVEVLDLLDAGEL